MRFLWESIATVALGGFCARPSVSAHGWIMTLAMTALMIVLAFGAVVGVNALYEWAA